MLIFPYCVQRDRCSQSEAVRKEETWKNETEWGRVSHMKRGRRMWSTWAFWFVFSNTSFFLSPPGSQSHSAHIYTADQQTVHLCLSALQLYVQPHHDLIIYNSTHCAVWSVYVCVCVFILQFTHVCLPLCCSKCLSGADGILMRSGVLYIYSRLYGHTRAEKWTPAFWTKALVQCCWTNENFHVIIH